MVRVSRAHFPVTALGPGVRMGVWFQGCSIGCRGCLALDTWSPDHGSEVSVDHLIELWLRALQSGASGLTISGGEASEQPESLLQFLEAVQNDVVEREKAIKDVPDVMLYTGHELDEFARRAPGALELIDVLVTGPFVASAPTKLIWRGSANQQMHLLTPRGIERFGEFVELQPERIPMQVIVDADSISYLGVPRHGDLRRIERALKMRGVSTEGVSWRP